MTSGKCSMKRLSDIAVDIGILEISTMNFSEILNLRLICP